MLVIWEIDDKRIEFRDPFRILKVDGIAISGVSIQTEKAPLQDGAFLVGNRFEPREITIEMVILGNSTSQETKRRNLISWFNPRRGEGTLSFVTNTGTYCIKGIASEIAFPQEVGRGVSPSHQVAIVSIFAPYPFFSKTPYSFILAGVAGGWSFPFHFTLSFGEISKSRTIYNTGDVPAPIFVSCRGPLEGITLRNVTTGEKIQFPDIVIPAGCYLEIDTTPGKKSITYIDESGSRSNAFSYLSSDSTLFLLQTGENKLEYSADVEGEGSLFTVSYYLWYIGL